MQSGGSGVGFSLNEPFWKDDFTECECLLFLEMRCNVIRRLFFFVLLCFDFFPSPQRRDIIRRIAHGFRDGLSLCLRLFLRSSLYNFIRSPFFFKSSVHLSVFLDEMCPFDDPEFELRHVRAETLATCQIARCALLFFALYSRNVDSRVRFIDRVALKSIMC